MPDEIIVGMCFHLNYVVLPQIPTGQSIILRDKNVLFFGYICLLSHKILTIKKTSSLVSDYKTVLSWKTKKCHLRNGIVATIAVLHLQALQHVVSLRAPDVHDEPVAAPLRGALPHGLHVGQGAAGHGDHALVQTASKGGHLEREREREGSSC